MGNPEELGNQDTRSRQTKQRSTT